MVDHFDGDAALFRSDLAEQLCRFAMAGKGTKSRELMVPPIL